MSRRPKDVTLLLNELQQGHVGAADQLIPLVYDELRRIAAGYMRSERSDHTLQPTALVHEAFLKLVDQRAVQWQSRAHFLGIAAQAMRRILVDHARKLGAAKRGGGRKVTLDEEVQVATQGAPEVDVVAVDEVLERLAELDERQSKVVELRFFGGLDVAETAEVLGISTATVKRDWRFAKAWLSRELSRDEP